MPWLAFYLALSVGTSPQLPTDTGSPVFLEGPAHPTKSGIYVCEMVGDKFLCMTIQDYVSLIKAETFNHHVMEL